MLDVKLKRLREERGWSQEELATRAHLSRNSIKRIEAPGTRRTWRPTLRTLEKLARALDVKVTDLLG